MTVYEADVPGVGKKFEVDLGGGERAVVVIHHDGKREVFRRPSPDADSERLFVLDGEQATVLGSILEGAYFQPIDLDRVRVPLGESIIEWLTVADDSPLAGRTLGEAALRQRTGVSVIAIQRGGETLANPEPEFEIEPGDVLVGLGTREEHDSLEALVAGEEGDDSDDAGRDESQDDATDE